VASAVKKTKDKVSLATAFDTRPFSQKKLCIGVCAYNEEKNIGLLLERLTTQQDLSTDCEIIVACSGCTDSTPEIVKAYRAVDARIKLIIESERKGKAEALNNIFKRASGSEVLILTNADAFPQPGSLGKLVKALDDSSVGAVAARPVPLSTGKYLSSLLVELIWDLHHKISTLESVKLSGELCALRPFLVKRIPPNLATDEPFIEMLIRRQGYKIGYVPDAVVYIRGPESLQEIVQHRRRIWTGHLQIQRMEGFAVSSSDFRRIFSMLVKSFRSNLRKLHVLALFIAVDLYSYLLARQDIARGRIPFIWETLKSTKTKLARNVKDI